MQSNLTHQQIESYRDIGYLLVKIFLNEEELSALGVVRKPHFVNNLSYARASFQSVNGLIKSEWERKGNKIVLHLLIPANSTASIYLPKIAKRKKSENEKLVDKKTNRVFTGTVQNESFSVYHINAGEYVFELNDFK